MIRRPPRSTPIKSSAASDVYKRQPLRSLLSSRSRKMATRNLEKAKAAYDENDVESSKQAHDELFAAAAEKHGGGGSEYVEGIVFGGLDGIITTFAIVVAAAASKLTYGTILILGLANILGDALSMAIGDYLSTKAEEDHEESERKREEWEVDNMPEVEKQEMIDIYVKKGLKEADAREVVELLFQTKEAFLDIMMIEELHLMPKSDEGSSAWKGALVTFVSFIFWGGLPMIPYVASGTYDQQAGRDKIFWAAVGVFSGCLYFLGAVKGKITGKKWYLTGFTMLINGGITSVLAYFIGYYLEYLGKRL
eukprot:TRINITY_DN434_c0_g1_i1.p1 TRINITY_DN434_c0_g1~~TRINITY_DN434_c0_g1_i1.p1  ORF type:complete len:308 (+),score=90.70 TRINITY_DN434_c0_g1_i1:2-925(+)